MEGIGSAAAAAWMSGPSAWLLVWLLKGSLLLALLFPLAALLRRSSSSARHLVWTVGLALVLAVPLASTGVLPWRLELPVVAAFAPIARLAGSAAARDRLPASGSQSSGPSVPGVAAGAESNGGRRGDVGVGTGLSVPPVAEGGEAAGASTGSTAVVSGGAEHEAGVTVGWSVVDVLWFAVLAWAAGAVLVVLWLGRSAIQAARLVRNGMPLADRGWTTPLIEAADRLDLPELPRLLVSADATVPLTCGIVRPSIVLPPASETWTDERRRAVLCHELAHIRRRDLVSHLLGRLTCALYWFQPLAWNAARRMRAESERACDDLVLLTGTRASAYADHLLEIAAAGRGGAAPAVAMPMAQPREFEARLLSILEPDKRREPLSRGQAAVLATLVLVLAQPLVALAPSRPSPAQSGANSTLRSDPREPEPVSPVANTDSVTTTSYSDDDHSVTADATEAASAPKMPAGATARPDPAPSTASGAVAAPMVEPAPSGEAMPSDRIVVDRDGLLAQADTGRRRNRQRSFDREIERGAEALAESVTDITLSTLGQVFRSFSGPAGQVDQQARAGLVEALSDPEPRVRRTAAWALSTHADSLVIRALVRAILTDDNQRVREMSAWALAQLNAPATDETAIEALSHLVVADASVDVRETAAWALADARTAGAATALERAVQTDAAASVRKAAAWALGVSAASSSTPALSAALAFNDADVRETAAWAIGTLDPDRAPGGLTDALRDSAPRVRQASAWALGRIADPESAPALQDAISDENAKVRSAVVWALGRLPGEAATDALAAALRDGDPDVRAAAAGALGGHSFNVWPWPWPWPRPRPQP